MRALLLITVLVAAALAGCAENDATPTPATGSPTPPVTATPSPSPSPSPLPSVGIPSSVTILSAPARGAAGSDALVCWRVEGTGKVAHVAVHWDAESHPGALTTFAAYDDGAVYPDNASSPAAAGYALPGDFCANVPIPSTGKVYYRAHAMAAGPPGLVSEERSTGIAGTATAVTIESAPETAAAGGSADVCWRVEGSGNVAHVAIHYDDESHSAPATVFSDYDLGASYPDNATSLSEAGFDLPATFCTSVPMPDDADLYLRGHVLDSNGVPGIVSSETHIRRA